MFSWVDFNLNVLNTSLNAKLTRVNLSLVSLDFSLFFFLLVR